MEFRILGPLEVWDADRRLTLGGPKHRALLAILLLEANRVVSIDRLVELLWGDEPPETVNNTLQVCVSQLRKILEPGHRKGTPYQVLVSSEPGYLIRLTPEQLDLDRFERLRDEATQATSDERPETAADALRQALALWRGPALAEFAAESFAVAEAARLDEIVLRALEDRIEADLTLGRHADLVGELEALVASHPLRERLRAQLMLALYRSGRQAEAAAVYHKTRTVLVEELGIEPGSELQKLLKAVLNQDPSLDPHPMNVTAARRADNLPHQLTSFVGRTRDIVEVTRLLSRTRLITLTGAGGIGKTRLAIEVAGRRLREDGAEVWLVELAPLSDPELVPQTVALTLGIGRSPLPPVEALTNYLKDRQLLLVLDNCEHVVDATARMAKVLLEKSPRLRILATSRESLGVQGEVAWHVPSLEVPESDHSRPVKELAGFEAVALFMSRAETAGRAVTLDDNSGALVVQLCARLDGIPLAIELAAARLNVLSLEQIVARLNDRFRLLSGGSRTALPRQQTLRNAIDWSYEMLSPPERALLRRISVFAGGIGLEGAEAVCGGTPVDPAGVMDLLAELIRKSLALVYDTGGEARYRLLETIRHYARDRLVEAGESEITHERHRDWFLRMAERAEPKLHGPEQLIWSERVELDHDNLRAAFEWSLETQAVDEALRLARAMGWFWHIRGHLTEGREWLSRVLTLGGTAQAESASLRAQLLAWTALLARDQGDSTQAVRLGEQSLAVYRQIGEPWGIGLALQILGSIAVTQDDHERATRLLEESLTILRTLRDDWTISRSLTLLSVVARTRGDYPRATALLEEALRFTRALGDTWHMASTLQNLGQLELSQGNYERAAQVLQETLRVLGDVGGNDQTAVVLYRLGVVARCREDYNGALAFEQRCVTLTHELGDKHVKAYALCELGIIAERLGHANRATAFLKDSVGLLFDVGDRWGLTRGLEALAAVALQQRQLARAARLFGAAEALREAIGAPIEPFERLAQQSQVDAVRAGLGKAASEELWNQGGAMTAEETLAFALEETTLVPIAIQ